MSKNKDFAPRKRVITPKTELRFSFLTKEDPTYGGFFANIVVNDDVQNEFLTPIQEIVNDSIKFAMKKNPKKVVEAAKNGLYMTDDGTLTMRVKSTKQPKFYNAKGLPIAAEDVGSLGNGSIVRLAVSYLEEPEVFNGKMSVSLRLDGVKIIKAVSYQSGPAGLFEDESEDEDENLVDGIAGETLDDELDF